jgi:hypothetical protein
VADISTRLQEAFGNKPLDEGELLKALEEAKYTNIHFSHFAWAPKNKAYLETIRVYHMDFYKEKRTLFLGISKNGNVALFRMENSNMNTFPSDNASAALGCFMLIGLIVLMIWGFSACMSSDIYEDDDDDYNPYTEDFDGDGLGGDKDDHDILQQLPTLPDGN